MEFGIQIASSIFMITILINYFRQKRLPILSTKIFTIFILVSLSNLIFEYLTLYTINNLDNVSAIINRLCHQFFIGSIDCIISLLFFYVDIRSRKQKKYNYKELIIRIFPMILTLLAIIFGPLHYYIGEDGYYSYGFMANTIFINVIVYMIPLVYIIFKRKNIFSKLERNTILLGIICWCIISLIQFINGVWLLSSLAIVTMIQFIYISFENSDKFLAIGDDCVFNSTSFRLVSDDFLKNNIGFYVVKVSINVSNSTILDYYYKSISKKINGFLFKIDEDNLYIIFTSFNDYNNYLENKITSEIFQYNDNEYNLKITKSGLVISNDFKTTNDIIYKLEENLDSIVAYKNSKQYNVKTKDIYYIEVIENQTFIYTFNDCYETKNKLYQIEGLLNQDGFLRISKSMIVNPLYIESIENYENSKMLAYLNNNESVIVSRKYVKDLKKAIL